MRDLSTAIAETISHLIRHAHLLYPALLPLTPTQSSIAFPNSCNSKCFRCIDSSIPSSIPSDFFAVEVARLFLGSAESLYRCLSTIDDSIRKCSNVIKLAYSSQRKMSLDSVSNTNPAPSSQSYTFPRTPCVPPRRYGPHVRQVGTPGPLLLSITRWIAISSGVAMYCSVRRGGLNRPGIAGGRLV
jgi:hypothetical protein